MQYKRSIFWIFLLFIPLLGSAQDNKSRYSTKKAIKELSKSLDENLADSILAKNYIQLAQSFAVKKQYDKAEENYKKAKAIYVKIKDLPNNALVERELAKLLELRNKIPEAIESYELAGKLATQAEMKRLNQNDANRLRMQNNPEAQSQFIVSNVNLSKKIQSTSEQQFALQQKVQLDLKENKLEDALMSLEEAQEMAVSPMETVELSQQMADVYIKADRKEEAIKMKRKAVEVAKEMDDPSLQIKQMKILSSSYDESDNSEAAMEVLEDAYDVAIKGSSIKEANEMLKQLTAKHLKERNTQKALELYADFAQQLDSLIDTDSTLIDSRLLEIQEQRISQLEKERALKDELIQTQNTINYVLIAVIILILVFIFFIGRTLYSITKKNKKIALQSLRREMNPHFIFNSLNSVNQFIAQNDELEANKYLTSYSRLMRTTMENSNKDFIPLSTEIEHLKEYLDLERLRFHDKFTYTLTIDPQIDTDFVLVPNMLIQPQLENAIWHGLRYREDKGLLQLSIEQKGQLILITIEDNGIGLQKSMEMKTSHQKKHNSRGLKNTDERINLLNSLYKSKIKFTIVDKKGDKSGVIATLEFPVNIK